MMAPPQQQGHAAGSPQEYFQFQNVSPEMLNMGLSAGQSMLERQREKIMPGMSGFWNSLKIYFAVSFITILLFIYKF